MFYPVFCPFAVAEGLDLVLYKLLTDEKSFKIENVEKIEVLEDKMLIELIGQALFVS